jgi:GNAT superfamily N-acetyltransferase
MSAVTLRPATGSDEPFLRALFRSTRETLLQAMPLDESQREFLCDMQFRAQEAGYRAAYPQAEHLVVCDEKGDPIGRLTRAWCADALVLVDIALVPQARGIGIGTSLVAALQDEARARGAPLSLSVEASSPALRLYRRMGFEATGDDGMRFHMRWPTKTSFMGEEKKWSHISEK